MVKRCKDTLAMKLTGEYTPPEVTVKFPEEVTNNGSTLDVKISRAVSLAMQGSDKTRETIASEMAEYLGDKKVTANMLDNYASTGKHEQKITVERLIALIHVTGAYELLSFVCEFSGFVAVPEKYSEVIELWATEEHLTRLEHRRALLRGSVKDLVR